METIHKVAKVVNNQVIINLPPGFEDNEMDVTLKPRTQDIREIEKKIDMGMASRVSPREHKEIFDNLRVGNVAKIIRSMNTQEIETLYLLLTEEGKELLERKKDFELGRVRFLTRDEVFDV